MSHRNVVIVRRAAPHGVGSTPMEPKSSPYERVHAGLRDIFRTRLIHRLIPEWEHRVARHPYGRKWRSAVLAANRQPPLLQQSKHASPA
jgi:hypothetical protein